MFKGMNHRFIGMNHRRIAWAAALCLCLLFGNTESQAQLAVENGISLEHFSSGMYAPTEMAFDPSGNLFIGSGYEPTWPYVGAPTPVFKVQPDGTCTPFSDPIVDPDALTVDSAGDVFVGSYGGVVTRIDGFTEFKSTWLVDSRLKNIDGLRFSPSGDLFAVAIDSAKVHKINPITKSVEEFVDLSSLGITGMSGIAFHPVTQHVFVASPLENVIVELDANGAILNPSVASGFLFLGFIDFDPSGQNDGYIFAPDALLGQIFKVDIATGQKILIIDEIDPGPVGLVFDSVGALYFNMNYDQVQQGDVYRAWNMEIDLPTDPNLGDPVSIVFRSKYDELLPFGAFLALDNNGPLLPDGRRFPLGINPLILLMQSMLDGNGEGGINFTIPNDPSLSGLITYFAFATYQASPFRFLSMSKATSMTIH